MPTSTKLYLDTRSKRAGGVSSLKLSIVRNGKPTQVALSVFLRPEQWDDKAQRVVGPNQLAINNHVAQLRMLLENALMELQRDPEYNSMPMTEVRKRLLDVLEPGRAEKKADKPKVGSFLQWYDRFMATKHGRTLDLYRATRDRLTDFEPELGKMDFEGVSKDWLVRFDASMSERSPSRNARNIHLRNIRAVFNYAIDNEVTAAYPFRRLQLKPEKTRKRSLTLEQLRAVATMELEPWLAKHRDMFMLMFMLCGINIVDLCRLKSIVDDRVEYRRAKTGRLYSIRVEPEAALLIDRLRGKDWLLFPLDSNEDYRHYSMRMNLGLKEIARRLGLGELTTYWARHSWATLARNAGVSKDDIRLGLGHGGSTVTDIYIDEDYSAVDRANRAVIDFVFKNKNENEGG